MSHATDVYLHFREVFGGKRRSLGDRARRARSRDGSATGASLPFSSGRDPVPLSLAIQRLESTFDWSTPIAQAAVVTGWAELVGRETAAHSRALHVDDGVLTVQCDSTAWATQLRLLRASLVTELAQTHPGAEIQSIKFLAPGAPSWRHGQRSVAGRGPRDTYG